MIVFSAIGHVIRDGLPALGSTHLARAAGAGFVFLGCWIITDFLAAAVLGLAVLAGFYTDAKHGEANKGDWTAGVISGCTSLAPLAVAASFLAMDPLWLLIVAAGALKPPIWKAAWAMEGWLWDLPLPAWTDPLIEPTRVAAIMWGALVGVLLFIIATQGA